jgi:hypothetical protein
LLNQDRYRARFTPKPGPISQSPRYVFLFEGVEDQRLYSVAGGQRRVERAARLFAQPARTPG